MTPSTEFANILWSAFGVEITDNLGAAEDYARTHSRDGRVVDLPQPDGTVLRYRDGRAVEIWQGDTIPKLIALVAEVEKR